MRKYSFFIILGTLLISVTSLAQDHYANYFNSYIDKEYEIQISFNEEKDSAFTLWIDALCIDDIIDNGGFRIEEKRYAEFIENLRQSKIKYDEWVHVAKENNVTDLRKDMDISGKRIGAYFKYGREWHYDNTVSPAYLFLVLENEVSLRYVLLVTTKSLTASDNQYIDCSGFVLSFTSSDEVDEFLDLISLESINKFKSKPKKDDLFK